MTTYFISGHLDLSDQEFQEHYVPHLMKAISDPTTRFIVGDAQGTDNRAQLWLWERKASVTVYHMFEGPRYNPGFPTKGGFTSDNQRDAAMTRDSDQDILWVRPGRERSGTARNRDRRHPRKAP